MIALPVLIVLTALCLTGCRKVPFAQPPKTGPAATPAAAAENPSANPAAAKAVTATPVPTDRSAQVIVLGYHRFPDKVRHPDTEITPADFAAQMKALKDQGIAVISLADFAAWRRGEKNIPPRSAIICIDDGYRQAYDVAWPVLKQLGYPFTLFIYTDYVRGGPKSGGGSLSWEQLAELRDAGVDIQSHTVSHPDLRGKKGRAPADYEAWLWNELNGSKEQIEQKLGIKVTALALPYGHSSEHIREVAAKAGYEMVFTVNGVKLGCDTPADALGRFMIDSSKPKIFATAVTFDRAGRADSAAPVAVHTLHPQPADGATVRDPKPVIRADLSALGVIENGSVTLRVSGVGAVPAVVDAASGTVSGQLAEKLRPGAATVILSARVDGRKVEAHWSFTVQDGEAAAAAKSPP